MQFSQNNLKNSAEQTATELTVNYAGWQVCRPGHGVGSGVRDHYLIHYIVSGRGEFSAGGRVYQLTRGDGFLICPSESTSYRSDPEDPWEYYWVGFSGPGAKMLLEEADLSSESPIFHCEPDENIRSVLTALSRAKSASAHVEYEALGYFYLFMSRLIENRMKNDPGCLDSTSRAVEKAIKYIQCNYWKVLSVNEIARYVGLDRSQLFRLFKLRTDASPQQYLIRYRIARACELIARTDLNIDEIARSVGFEYSTYFFRLFKKLAGVTPTEYRQNALHRVR